MKTILIFLLITVNALTANNILHQQDNSEKGCTIPFFEKKKISCSSKIEEKAQNSESKRKEQLNAILHKVKKYKEKTENEKNNCKRS